MLSENLSQLFKSFNDSQINYVLLRGYTPFDEIETGKDIDIYIDRKDKKKARNLLAELGWRTPRINANQYPHEQYFFLTVKKLYKLDIVWGICYGDKLYQYKYEKEVFKNRRTIEDIYLPSEKTALELFILHILFDKGMFSQVNYVRFQQMYEEYQNSLGGYKERGKILHGVINCFSECAMRANGIEHINRLIENYIIRIQNETDLLEKNKSYWLCNLKTKINALLRYKIHKLHRKSICFIGVDGSGKSTTIKQLSNTLGDMISIQYMGFKDYETHIAKKYYQNIEGIKYRNKLLPFLSIYWEMWCRYMKNRYKSTGITIFDRFVWEAFDNASFKYRCVYWILFKCFFPNPKLVYFLHCSVETSFQRKDDIQDENTFGKMKKRFDKTYLNKKNVKSFDTDKINAQDIVKQICEDMNQSMYEYLF